MSLREKILAIPRRWCVRLGRRLISLGAENNAGLRESLEDILHENSDSPRAIGEEERDMLMNIVGFHEARADDVMVPRADIVAVEENCTLEELLQVFRKEGHSRIPVYRENLDDPRGMVHIKDVVRSLASGDADDVPGRKNNFTLKPLMRRLLFVPPSMPAADLLVRMQTARMHLALVIDEYGGTDGLVSIEDLVEEIVGDIEDEHDIGEGPLLVRLPSGGIKASARAPIADLAEMTGLDLLPDDEEEEVDTLGGLVVFLAGRVPQRGELISHPAGLEFEVREADPRRIKRLLIHIRPTT
ncbi:MAG: hemolysin family protein [Hyphomicrobiales bacterium]|nr:hemolysin family protein [Hyphomicrobiales bacterium]